MLASPLLNPTLAMISLRCVPRTAVALSAALTFTPLLCQAEKPPREPSRQARSPQQTLDTQKIPDRRVRQARAERESRSRKNDLQELLRAETRAHANLAHELARALEAQTHLTELTEASAVRLRKALVLQKHIARQATATSAELRRTLQTREEENEKARAVASKLNETLALERQKMKIERAAFETVRLEHERRLATLQSETSRLRHAHLAVKIEPLRFGMNRTASDEDENLFFTQIRTLLAMQPDATFRLTGHTCNIGDSRTNLTLSERRARHVAQFLIRRGIPAAQIVEVRGLGPDQPLADNSTLTGRRLNRRVEVEILAP